MKRLFITLAVAFATLIPITDGGVASAVPLTCSTRETFTTGEARCTAGRGQYRAATYCKHYGTTGLVIVYGPWRTVNGNWSQWSVANCNPVPGTGYQEGPTWINTR